MKKYVCICLMICGNSHDFFCQVIAGPNNPGTVSNVNCSFAYGAGSGYSPPGNVITSNNVYATFLHCACCDANTQCLYARNFGFSIPAGSIIQGIQVDVEKSAPLGSNVQDNGIRLSKAGVEVGNNYMSAASWPSFDTYTSYGSCSDLWGTTWTSADINDPNFGVYFASIDYSCMGNITSSIDHIRIRICYNPPLPLPPLEMIVKKNKKNIIIHLQKKIPFAENIDSVKLEINNSLEEKEVLFSSPAKLVPDKKTINLDIKKQDIYALSLYAILKEGEKYILAKENVEIRHEPEPKKIICFLSGCLSVPENTREISVFSIDGKKVFHYELSESLPVENKELSLFKPGIYLVKALTLTGEEYYTRWVYHP